MNWEADGSRSRHQRHVLDETCSAMNSRRAYGVAVAEVVAVVVDIGKGSSDLGANVVRSDALALQRSFVDRRCWGHGCPSDSTTKSATGAEREQDDGNR